MGADVLAWSSHQRQGTCCAYVDTERDDAGSEQATLGIRAERDRSHHRGAIAPVWHRQDPSLTSVGRCAANDRGENEDAPADGDYRLLMLGIPLVPRRQARFPKMIAYYGDCSRARRTGLYAGKPGRIRMVCTLEIEYPTPNSFSTTARLRTNDQKSVENHSARGLRGSEIRTKRLHRRRHTPLASSSPPGLTRVLRGLVLGEQRRAPQSRAGRGVESADDLSLADSPRPCPGAGGAEARGRPSTPIHSCRPVWIQSRFFVGSSPAPLARMSIFNKDRLCEG